MSHDDDVKSWQMGDIKDGGIKIVWFLEKGSVHNEKLMMFKILRKNESHLHLFSEISYV